jgi:hypothetical protein
MRQGIALRLYGRTSIPPEEGENMKAIKAVVTMVAIAFSISASARGEEIDKSELAKQAQNPVADLISLPFQNNINFNAGPQDETQNILNIQPVAPISLTEKWNLITRTIIPIVWQPEFVPGRGRTTGMGDINFKGFLSPGKPGKLIWGAGPVILFPSATDDALGTGKWGAGPSAVFLMMNPPWVNGFLINNIWSFAGSDTRRDVNQMLLQPFVNYNLPHGWYLVSAPIITGNWAADSGNRWTLPIGMGAGKVLRLGKLPLNCSAQGYYNLDKPVTGGDRTLRLQAQVLLPKTMFSGGT